MNAKNNLIICLIIAFVLIWSSSSACAAEEKSGQLNKPNPIRTVQKDNIDNIRIFGTITSALASIPADQPPSETNRFTIKVMPGVYDESVTMKAYVDLEGSGRDSTVISSSLSTTVTAANNASIRNITIANSAASGFRTGISFDNVTSSLENVAVEILGGSEPLHAVSISGGANVYIKNIRLKIIAENSSKQEHYGIRVDGAGSRVSVSDSHLTVDGSGCLCEIAALVINYKASGDVMNSLLKTSNAWDNYGVEAEGSVKIVGSKIIASDTKEASATVAVGKWGAAVVDIRNSEIRAENIHFPIKAYSFHGAGAAKVAESLIQGHFEMPVKLLNCRDQDNKPITDQ